MERQELKKLIGKNFDSYAKECGYAHRLSPSGLFWYKIENNIMRSIAFETKSDGYCPIYFIQPLYMGFDYIVLSYGKDISHCRHDEYYFYKDSSEEKIALNLEHVKSYLNSKVNKTLEKLCNPKMLVKNPPKKILFLSPYDICELKAYSNLYIGNYNRAYSLFSKLLPQTLLNSSVAAKIEQVLDLLKNSKSKIPEFLQSNINKSVTSLKLNVE